MPLLPRLHAAQYVGDAVEAHGGEGVVGGIVVDGLEVRGVPQAHLGDARIQPDLVHPARPVARVGLTGVPQSVVEDEQRARRARERALADHVLVARDLLGADPAQVAPRDEARPSLPLGHGLGEVEELDVEGGIAGIDDGVHVQVLAVIARPGEDVDEVVVVERILAHERGDDAPHGWQPEHLPEHRGRRIALREGGAAGRSSGELTLWRNAHGLRELDARQPRQLLHHAPVELGGDEPSEAQVALGDEACDLERREAVVRGGQARLLAAGRGPSRMRPGRCPGRTSMGGSRLSKR